MKEVDQGFINELYFDPFPQAEGRGYPAITLPFELNSSGLQQKLEAVGRYQFQGYPPRINDNVWAHTVRGIKKLSTLPHLSDNDKAYGKLMYLVHDIGEAYDTADVTIIDKVTNIDLAKLTAEREKRTAKDLLPPDYFKLWEMVEDAGDLLKGHQPTNEVLPIAVLVKVLDSCEGPLVFHYPVSRFFKNHHKEKWDGSPCLAFTHFWNKYHSNQLAFSNLHLPEPYNQLCLNLNQEIFSFVSFCWSDIPTSNQPEVLQPLLRQL